MKVAQSVSGTGYAVSNWNYVLAVVSMEIFWDMTPCSPVEKFTDGSEKDTISLASCY
jgi:hypothetical protein